MAENDEVVDLLAALEASLVAARETVTAEPECDGKCVAPEDIDVMGTGVEVVYPHVDCPRHGPNRDLRH